MGGPGSGRRPSGRLPPLAKLHFKARLELAPGVVLCGVYPNVRMETTTTPSAVTCRKCLRKLIVRH